MPSLSQIPNFNLKVIFLVHFVFTALSALGHWSSSGYLFYNSVLIAFLIWSILYQEHCQEPLQLAIVVNGCSIILDILLLVMAFPEYHARAIDKFSAAFSVLHLIIRPFSTIFLVKYLEERSGSTGTGIIPSSRNDTYEDIDRPSGTAFPPAPGIKAGYDFSTAQQI